MAGIQIGALAFAVIGVLAAPSRIPHWVAPVIAATFLLLVGGTDLTAALNAVRPLQNPLLFLVMAVPLAVMLDRLGFFESLAALIRSGRNVHLGLWTLAALVTTFLNLDAAVVLLTPLYIRIARQRGMSATLLAFQPALLACLASSALPISNLTNLIAAEQLDIKPTDFLIRIGVASLVATVVGWFAYRRLSRDTTAAAPVESHVDRRALIRGTPIALFVVIGFTVGDQFGIHAWMVALIANVVLLAMTRTLKFADIPTGAIALTGGLAIVSAAASHPLGIHNLLQGSDVEAQLRALGLATAGAGAINNLPAVLTSLPSLTHHPELVWPVLFAVNVGPIFILHGSLAGLLWRDTAARLGVHISPWHYMKVGFKVGAPAYLAGAATLLATSALVGNS